jgi:hypothetical protein
MPRTWTPLAAGTVVLAALSLTLWNYVHGVASATFDTDHTPAEHDLISRIKCTSDIPTVVVALSTNGPWRKF